MYQFYLLSILYLLFFSSLLVSDKYAHKMLFLIGIKNFYYNSKNVKRIMFLAGLVLEIGLCFLPMEPGPVFIGDILPGVTIVLLLLFQLKQFEIVSSSVVVADKKKENFGFAVFVISIIHFVFPSIIIL